MNKNVSISMRIHNSIDCLPRTLQWCLENFEEINIVESGANTDGSEQLLRKYKDRINLFTREDDGFKNQSNFILEKSTKPWTFLLDADEIIYGPWSLDQVVKLMEKENRTMCSMDRLNFQQDIYHTRSPLRPDPQVRLVHSGARVTGEMHELWDFSKERLMFIPQLLMLHWGHIRSKEKLVEKSMHYKKYIKVDHVDGKNIEAHDDWFHRRNKEWNKNLTPINNEELITFAQKWDGINE